MPTKSSLPFNITQALRELQAGDPKLASVIKRAGPPLDWKPTPFGTPFRALTRSIIYQQLSGKAAATIFSRFEGLFTQHFGPRSFTPANLLRMKDPVLRGAGVSSQKIAALRSLAAHSEGGRLPGYAAIRRMSDAEIIERLVEVRGIGPWSAQMFLIFRLGRPDVFSPGDLGIQKGYAITYLGDAKRLPKPDKLEKFAERWAPWRSVACWYLWRAVDLEKAEASRHAKPAPKPPAKMTGKVSPI